MDTTIGRRRMLGVTAFLAAAPGCALTSRAAAADPGGKPILTITGKIKTANHDASAVFDRAMLEDLGMTGFETSTPWYNVLVRFDGVLMSRLLDAVGAYGDRLTAYALNDYQTDIPVEDVRRFGAILALKRDGQYMPVRDKGPLFIVYPYDSDPELKNQRYYTRSAWQVNRLNIS